jgi:DnaJ-class molecular chaperone
VQQSQIQLNIFNLPIVRLFIYNKYIFTEDRINYLLKKDITITMNLYEILHVAEDAPEEIIKLAYKGLVQKYHPDRYKANDANQKMVAIRNAYEVLIDPIQRKAYDEKLKKIESNLMLNKN